jgi:hypothetical protein
LRKQEESERSALPKGYHPPLTVVKLEKKAAFRAKTIELN